MNKTVATKIVRSMSPVQLEKLEQAIEDKTVMTNFFGGRVDKELLSHVKERICESKMANLS